MSWKNWGLVATFFLVFGLILLKYLTAPNSVYESTLIDENHTTDFSRDSHVSDKINQTYQQEQNGPLCEFPSKIRKNFEYLKIQFYKKKATLWLLNGGSRIDIAATLVSLVGQSQALDWYYSTINISMYSSNIGTLIETLDRSSFKADTLSHSVNFDPLLSDFKVSMRGIFTSKDSVELNISVAKLLQMYPDIAESVFIFATNRALENKSSIDAVNFLSQVTKNDWNANIWMRILDLYGLESISENEQDDIIQSLSRIGAINLPFQNESPFSKLQIASPIFKKYEHYFLVESSGYNKFSESIIFNSQIADLRKDNPLLSLNSLENCKSPVESKITNDDLKTDDMRNISRTINANDYPELKALCEIKPLDYIDAMSLFKTLLHNSNLYDKDLNKLNTWKRFDWNVLNNSLHALNKNEQSTMISMMYSHIYPDNPSHIAIYKTFIENGFYVKEFDLQFFSIIMNRSSALEIIDLLKIDNYIEEKSGFGLPLIALISGNSQLSLQLMDKGYPMSSEASSLLAGIGVIESIGGRDLEGQALDAQIELMNRTFSDYSKVSKWHINAMAKIKNNNRNMFNKIYQHFPELFPYEPKQIFEIRCN